MTGFSTSAIVISRLASLPSSFIETRMASATTAATARGAPRAFRTPVNGRSRALKTCVCMSITLTSGQSPFAGIAACAANGMISAIRKPGTDG